MRMSDWSSDVCSSDLVAGDLDLLPGRELGVDLPELAVRLRLEVADFLTDIHAVRRQMAELLDLGFELKERLFEVEGGQHGVIPGCGRRPAGRGAAALMTADRKSTRLNSSH